MAIYMITTWEPFHKIEEADKLAPKAPTEIPYIKRWQVLSTPDGKDGMKTYNIIFIEEGKEDEAKIHIMNLLSYFNEIEGYSYKIEPLLSPKDIQKIAALKTSKINDEDNI